MFGSCKSIFGKYSIFRKCYFPKRKMFSCVWLPQNSFYGKLISVLVHSDIFTENALHDQFSTHFLTCKHANNESIPHSFTEETKPSKKINLIRSNWDRAAEEKMRLRGRSEIGGEIGAIVRRVARSTSALVGQSHRSSIVPLVHRRARSQSRSSDVALIDRRAMRSPAKSLIHLSLSPI